MVDWLSNKTGIEPNLFYQLNTLRPHSGILHLCLTKISLQILLQIVYSKLSDLLPSEITNEEDPTLKRPDDEEIDELTDKTKKALEKITRSKIAAAMPVRCAEKQAPAQYIRYTPSQQGQSFNSGAKQRVIRMVEAQVDPLEPPKFKYVEPMSRTIKLTKLYKI